MRVKKILIFVNNDFAATQMSAQIIGNQNFDLTVVITDIIRSHEKKIIHIKNAFKIHGVKKFYLLKKNFFSPRINFKKIFSFFNNIKLNNKNIQKIKKFLKNNDLDLCTYDEFWFSNDSVSKYIAHYFGRRCIFFFHAFMDINNLKIENFVKIFKIKIFNYLNSKYLKIVDVNHYAFKGRYATILKNIVTKSISHTLPEFIDFNKFNYIRHKIYGTVAAQHKSKKIILINAHIPAGYSFSITKKYCNFFSNKIMKYLTTHFDIQKYEIILKSKPYTNKIHLKYILKSFRNINKAVKIYDSKHLSKNEMPLDVLGSIFKPDIYITIVSSADWVIAKNHSNVKFIYAWKMFLSFWENAGVKIRTNSHKNNHENMKKIYPEIKKFGKVEI